MPGTNEALPNTFNCSDFANNAIKRHKPSVAPDPPIITKVFWNSPANGIFAPSIFNCIFDNTIGVIKAPKIGRASCRERVKISVGEVSLKKKNEGERERRGKKKNKDAAR